MDYAVIGKTLTHSFSAEIHPKLFKCNYEKKELNEDELDKFMRNRDFLGINVTIPYKKAVIPYIDFLDETAELTGTVNTVINKNGKLFGYNTDYLGLKALIEKNNVDISGKNVLIFGSGATSCTAKALCENLGAKTVNRFSRSEKYGFSNYKEIEKFYNDTDVIINATPCGTYPDIYKSAAEIENFKDLKAVFDVVYNPIRSKLVCDALKMGITAEGGTMMLVFQAVFAARLFSGKDIPYEKGITIYNNMLKEKSNIVLIGMPSSGKTTIGKFLSEKTGKKFFDTDSEIEKITGKTPKEIINFSGEEIFRDIESETISELSRKQNLIIATGGGAVLREKNIDLLRENGIVVYLDRKFEDLEIDKNRPLSSTKDKLSKMYFNRKSIYEKYADFIICEKSEIETADKILKEINFENSCYKRS